MDSGQLQAFERIVREGGFSRAARALAISQPAISARIQALEQEVGGPLFRRGGRGLALTERGQSFLPYAQRALLVLAEGVEAARLTQEGLRGRVTLGVIQSLADAWLAPIVTALRRAHPQIELAARVGHSPEIVEQLHDGVVKLGLLTWPLVGALPLAHSPALLDAPWPTRALVSPHLTPLVRFREPIALVAAPSHPLARGGPITEDELAALAQPLWALHWSHDLMPLLARIRALASAGAVNEAPSSVTRQLLLRGEGAAFFIGGLVEEDLAAGRLVEIPLAGVGPLERESALARLSGDAPLSAAEQVFVEAARAVVGRQRVG